MDLSPSPTPARPASDDSLEGAWVVADAPLLTRALRRAAAIPRNIVSHRALWLAGSRRELQARLSGTVLGRLWPLLQPLALFSVYYTLFARVFGMRFAGPSDAWSSATGVYLFLGVVTWSAFAEGLARGTVAFTERGELLKRAAFPAEILPLQTIVAQQLLMFFGLCAFVALTLFTDIWPAPGFGLALVPVIFVLQAVFTLGLSLATATMHALLRDTVHFVGVLTTLWMFATPIFWIPSAGVLPGVAPFLPWLEWNPMHAFVSCWRNVLMGSAPAEAFTNSLAVSLLHAALWSLAALAIGGFLFALGARRLPDEI